MDLKFRTLYPNEIECRAAQVTEKGVNLLLYKDARVDQRLLDEVVGPMNWQRHHSRDNANCTVAIWDSDKKQWIEKEDTGKESNTEAEKGLASDSFKRACFNWGIGRELYTAPFIWIAAEDVKLKEAGTDSKGKTRYTTSDRFEVSMIQYDENDNISGLVVRNKKSKKVVFTYGKETAKETSTKEKPKAAQPKQETQPKEESNPAQLTEEQMAAVGKEKINAQQIASLAAACADKGIPVEKLLKLYKVQSLTDLTVTKLAHINQHWEQIQKA